MKYRLFSLMASALAIAMIATGCGKADSGSPGDDRSPFKAGENAAVKKSDTQAQEEGYMAEAPSSQSGSPLSGGERQEIPLTSKIIRLEDGFSAVRFEGDDGFEDFLAGGGASSDQQVVQFLSSRLLADFDILGSLFGCSTVAVGSPEGDQLFGRNFDWQACDALVVSSKPEKGYSSISTVNMDFISQSGGLSAAAMSLDDLRVSAALYAPLDGMNEAGLAVSVNMIEDGATIEQNTAKPDITTTTAIRLLLNKAANVDEALTLLSQYDMHGSMGMMVHLALADAAGRSVAVEYVDNEMIVTETPVVTNFYLAQGPKHGVGSRQSHERYKILTDILSQNKTMNMDGVRDALDRVSKDNFGEFESTEWSIVFNLSQGEVHYYHRENYENSFIFKI